MKSIYILLTFLLSVFTLQAQQEKDWEGLSNMKTVMKQIFPPLIKENNLQPAKDNAAKLYELAVSLKNGAKPKAFRKKSMTDKFTSIITLSESLKGLMESKAPDEAIKNELVSLHTAFAEIAHHKKAGAAKQ